MAGKIEAAGGWNKETHEQRKDAPQSQISALPDRHDHLEMARRRHGVERQSSMAAGRVSKSVVENCTVIREDTMTAARGTFRGPTTANWRQH